MKINNQTGANWRRLAQTGVFFFFMFFVLMAVVGTVFVVGVPLISSTPPSSTG